MKRLEDRHWLPMAKSLGVGEDTKIIHSGCGNRPSLYIKHDADSLWAYCHRCRASGNEGKTFQRIKVKAPEKSGWFPKETLPLLDAVVLNPYQFSAILSMPGIAKHISLLSYSADTMRVYLPDMSSNYLGLDVTGAATARWYAPTRRACVVWQGLNTSSLMIVSRVSDYLLNVRAGNSVCWALNPSGRKAVIAWLCEQPQEAALADDNLPRTFINEIRAIKCLTVCSLRS
ncbi:hypothetical protein BN110_028_1 [Yersinia phage phiR8-01]|uniref:Uncharacterized protein n=1 Tax=Yersinia phage phiR8-01 TaxID=1206556 RepID=I7J3R8_9CAUD|nr:DNA primase [Yersinia phage phiR8-01]CCI88398.2 hypothetical protein BN110_028_1 [Yersinia phage phiR8-01]